jgi:predicted nucleic acid-binding protein
MREFFDTSVLVAAFWSGHQHHDASVLRLATTNKKQGACGINSLAEVYAVMTALPVKPSIPAEQALLFVEEARSRLTLVALDEEEYVAAIQSTAGRGLTSGKVYDALLLACAAKVKAQAIYTLNARHFRAIAPQLADRIQGP